MKNPPFNYHRPATLTEALELLAEHGENGKVLAGGQSLLPVMALRLGRPEHIIDIGTIDELATIHASEGVLIGAMVRHAEAEKSPDVARLAPLVAAALPHVGHTAIRTRGTVVGSIAHADAAAEMPAVCLATRATLQIRSASSSRQVAAGNFFDGYFTTALEPDELVTSVYFPAITPDTGTSVVEISRRHSDYAMAGLACQIEAPDGIISSAALAFFGVSSTPVRVASAEAALIGKPPGSNAFGEAAKVVTEALETFGDVHATAEYRRHIAGVLTKRGLAEATSTIRRRNEPSI